MKWNNSAFHQSNIWQVVTLSRLLLFLLLAFLARSLWSLFFPGLWLMLLSSPFLPLSSWFPWAHSSAPHAFTCYPPIGQDNLIRVYILPLCRITTALLFVCHWYICYSKQKPRFLFVTFCSSLPRVRFWRNLSMTRRSIILFCRSEWGAIIRPTITFNFMMTWWQ